MEIIRDEKSRTAAASNTQLLPISTVSAGTSIPTPLRGAIAYDSLTDNLYFATGTAWEAVGSGNETFDPCDPVFHGTGTTNTALGTVKIGPYVATDNQPGQITIGGYLTDPSFGFASPSNFALAGLVIGGGCQANDNARGSIILGTNSVAGITGVNGSGAACVTIGVSGSNTNSISTAIGFTVATGSLASTAIGALLTIDDTSDAAVAIGSQISLATSPAVVLLGAGSSIIGSGSGVAIGANNDVEDSPNTITIGSSQTTSINNQAVVIGDQSTSITAIRSLVLGSNIEVETITESMALGNNISMVGQGVETLKNIILGYNVNLNSFRNNNIIIGSGVSLENVVEGAIYIGSSPAVSIFGDHSIGIGTGATTGNSTEAVAIGHNAVVNQLSDKSIAVGAGATIDSSVASGTAIGDSARVRTQSGLALGAGSDASASDHGFSIGIPSASLVVSPIAVPATADAILYIVVNGVRYQAYLTAAP